MNQEIDVLKFFFLLLRGPIKKWQQVMKLKYNSAKPHIESIRRLVGPDNILIDKADMVPYLRDHGLVRWSDRFSGSADVVVIPKNVEQVSEIAKLANSKKIPITPRGGGTGYAGNSVPNHGGIVLDVKKMDKIIEINEEHLFVVAEAGIETERLNNELRKKGYMGLHDPQSAPSQVIGGALSTSGTSMTQLLAGTIKDFTYGLEVVLASGQVIYAGTGSGKPVSKSSTGYDLCHLFIGDHGTLGIKTKAWMRIGLMPDNITNMGLKFKSFEKAVKALQKMLRVKVPGLSRAFVADEVESEEATLFLTIMGEEKIAQYGTERVMKISREYGGNYLGDEHGRSDWEARYDSVAQAAGYIHANLRDEDPQLLIGLTPIFRKQAHEIVKKHGFKDLGFVLYANDSVSGDAAIAFVFNEFDDEKRWEDYRACCRELSRVALEMGGSISGLIGFDTDAYGSGAIDLLRMEFGPTLEVMRNIKKALDPNEIMNPGVLLFD